MADNYDQLALSWVRQEINNSLDKARQGLENFAEDSKDKTQIQFCVASLHQVQGTLQMLDFTGAAKLAAEMENLASKMGDDPSSILDNGFEVLMRALLQMPGYLERVEAGQKDIPVILLPLINELRLATSLPPVSEKELFKPQISGVIPPKAVEAVSQKDKTTEFKDHAKKLRANFQKGFTGILRSVNVKESLTLIHRVLLRLEALTEGKPVARLWWVADGFVLAIAENNTYKKKEIHQLLAQIDKQIKQLSDKGSEAMDDVISEQLLSSLLYFVAQSKSSNKKIESLKKQFDLDNATSSSEVVKSRQAELAKPDTSAVLSVASAINEELASVKDQLDLFVRAEAKDVSQLQNLVNSLTRIGDTLTMLELAIPRDIIVEQVKLIQQNINHNKMPDDAMIMDIAGALLFVEANLENINLNTNVELSGDISAQEASQEKAKETQVDDATQAMIKAARKNMQIAKDKMISYIASGFEREVLADVPALLEGVLAGIKIIQFDSAAEILQVAQDFVKQRIINIQQAPQEVYLNALADVITSVEYYLEASEEGKIQGVDSILKGAELGVRTLNHALQEPIPEAAESNDDLAEDSSAVRSKVDDEFEAEVIPILHSAADKEIDETLIDDEVFEIFIEEADEEIDVIKKMLPRWAGDLQDNEALTTLRRSFHTLKGSGRLVGAKEIGELGWAVENMLNKVIEESIPADKSVTSIIDEAQVMLSEMIVAFAKKTSFSCDDQQLIAKAEHVTAGNSLADFKSKAEEIDTDISLSETSTANEVIDPILLEIFSTEAEGHLKSISSYIKAAPDGSKASVSDELIRALHTLKGSAKMAGIAIIANLAAPWEAYARLIKGSGQYFESETLNLLEQTHDCLLKTVTHLKKSEAIDAQDSDELRIKIEKLNSNNDIPGAASKTQRDQQFVSIFLTEGLDILQEVSKLNDLLKQDLSNLVHKESLKMELNAFHLGAEMLAITELEELSAAVEKIADFINKSDLKSADFYSLISEVVEKLTDMLNKIASEEDLEPPQTTIDKIENWLLKQNLNKAPSDMDIELVELFAEEGEELIATAREFLSRWKDDLNNKAINSELRRIYHTLKGSSRMAGAMAIGDLAYAVEDIFNTVLEFSRELAPTDYVITVASTDKLETMVSELKSLKWPADAPNEIKKIRDHLSPDTVDVSQPVSVNNEMAETTEVGDIQDDDEFILDDSELFASEVTKDSSDNLPDEDIFVLDTEFDENINEENITSISNDLDEITIDAVAEDLDEITLDIIPEDPDEMTLDLIPEEPDEITLEAIPEDLDEIVLGAIPEDLDEIVLDAIPEDLDEIVLDAIPEDLDEIVLDAIPEDLDEIVLDAIPEDQDEIVVGATAEDEQKTVDDVTETANEIESDLDSAIEESLTQLELNDNQPAEVPSSSTKEKVERKSMDELAMAAKKASGIDVEKATTSVDTITPSEAPVVTGNTHKIELDEDGEEILDIYLEEADELLIALDEALTDWSASLTNKDAIAFLQRTLHTFKGGARLSELMVLGDLTHEMETYFEKVNNGQLTPKEEDVNFILQGYDLIEALISEVREHRQLTVPEDYMKSLFLLVKGEPFTATDTSSTAKITEKSYLDKVDEASKDESQTSKLADIVSFEDKKQQADAKQKQAKTSDVVRVPTEQLENLVNLAGETSIFRSRLEQQMSVLRYNLEEMNSTVDRLRGQLRSLDIETEAQISYRREISGGVEYEDFDPLEMDRYTRQQELTRGLGESAEDLLSLKDTLDSLTSDSETLLVQQGRVNTEMQESLIRTRMVSFESMVPRLRRMVRQISTELGKTIELSINADGEMDRTVLERLIAPLEHMLRNAMDHGIESPAQRKVRNKPEKGSIKIDLYREGGEIFVKVEDDGRGLNLKVIKNKAVDKGLIKESTELTDHEIQQLILEAGFSTAQEITQISGRGVGLDVVNSEIKQLGGVIEIDSVHGKGSVFTVKLPFTVSINHALMVQIGDEVFAIPLANIEGIVRVSPSDLDKYYEDEDSHFEYAGINYGMYYLGRVLDHNRKVNLDMNSQPLPVLLLHGADHPTALQVDDLLGSREIVVKSIGSQLSAVSGLSGATILGDGRVVLILDMPALIRRIDSVALDVDTTQYDEEHIPVVMVVDDSITVRKVTTRLLERHNFEVITAKDGIDALSVLNEKKPDVMLLDIEMPRMDGFELATIIRHDEHLKDLSIIMITSRTGAKHRERAEQIGVDEYMGKPYNEVDLVESITALLPKRV